MKKEGRRQKKRRQKAEFRIQKSESEDGRTEF
jgi:hypothetical protein